MKTELSKRDQLIKELELVSAFSYRCAEILSEIEKMDGIVWDFEKKTYVNQS